MVFTIAFSAVFAKLSGFCPKTAKLARCGGLKRGYFDPPTWAKGHEIRVFCIGLLTK
jgi:hypothetical protein